MTLIDTNLNASSWQCTLILSASVMNSFSFILSFVSLLCFCFCCHSFAEKKVPEMKLLALTLLLVFLQTAHAKPVSYPNIFRYNYTRPLIDPPLLVLHLYSLVINSTSWYPFFPFFLFHVLHFFYTSLIQCDKNHVFLSLYTHENIYKIFIFYFIFGYFNYRA